MRERRDEGNGPATAPLPSQPGSTPASTGRHEPAPSFVWQAINFAVVGLSGTAITFTLLTLLHKGLGWNIVPANVVAYSVGILNNYVLNRLWTFRHIQHKNVLHQGGQFALVSIGGLVINTVALTVLHADRLNFGLHYMLAFAGAAALAFCWNFIINHQFTFRHKAPAALHALAHPHGLHSQADPSRVPLPSDTD